HRYITTLPPSDAELERARAFFVKGSPRYVFTCASFHQFPQDSPVAEVAFLGRSNVGKSSLLNALFGRRSRGSGDSGDVGTAKVSNRAGKTRTMNVFLVGEGVDGGVKAPQTDMHGKVIKGTDRERWIGPGKGVAVVDMPGHGHASRVEWGEEIVKYLTRRKQLRRAFVLIDAEHGMKGTDRQLLDLLEANGVPHQVVLSKADKLVLRKLRTNSREKLKNGLAKLEEAQATLRAQLLEREKNGRGLPALGDILAVSSMKAVRGAALENFDKLGINGLRWAILQAAGLEK
ncbi:P-loop containing nucleoside triphosphate hydrolase protein, partial [Macrophomina phaseolina]